jgi:hypothetical protein
MKTKNLILALPFILAFTLFLNSCKQPGCTDKKALNYNVAADEDNGTCIYCETVINPDGSTSFSLIDNNPSSPYFNSVVAVFTLSEVAKSFNDQICGSDSCVFSLSIQNLVANEMGINYQVFSNFLGDVFSTADIPSHTTNDSVVFRQAGSNCQNISGSSLSVSTNGNIVYH